jgi:hypothetical protein
VNEQTPQMQKEIHFFPLDLIVVHHDINPILNNILQNVSRKIVLPNKIFSFHGNQEKPSFLE